MFGSLPQTFAVQRSKVRGWTRNREATRSATLRRRLLRRLRCVVCPSGTVCDRVRRIDRIANQIVNYDHNDIRYDTPSDRMSGWFGLEIRHSLAASSAGERSRGRLMHKDTMDSPNARLVYLEIAEKEKRAERLR